MHFFQTTDRFIGLYNRKYVSGLLLLFLVWTLSLTFIHCLTIFSRQTVAFIRHKILLGKFNTISKVLQRWRFQAKNNSVSYNPECFVGTFHHWEKQFPHVKNYMNFTSVEKANQLLKRHLLYFPLRMNGNGSSFWKRGPSPLLLVSNKLDKINYSINLNRCISTQYFTCSLC